MEMLLREGNHCFLIMQHNDIVIMCVLAVQPIPREESGVFHVQFIYIYITEWYCSGFFLVWLPCDETTPMKN